MHLRSHAAARGMTWGEHLKHAFKESPLSHLLDRPVLLCLHLLPLLHTPLVLGLPSWPSPILFCLPPYLSQSHWEITLHHLHCSFPFSPDNSPLLIPAVLSRWGPRFSIIKYRIPLSPPPPPSTFSCPYSSTLGKPPHLFWCEPMLSPSPSSHWKPCLPCMLDPNFFSDHTSKKSSGNLRGQPPHPPI